MQDLNHVMDENGLFVLDVVNSDLVPVDGMEGAILVSLFTVQRVDESDLRDPIKRGGWYGNVLTPDRQLGSKLWLLENAQITSGLIGKFKEYAQRSFDWAVKDGITRSVAVQVNLVPKQTIRVSLTIIGRAGIKTDYQYLWLKTKRRVYQYA